MGRSPFSLPAPLPPSGDQQPPPAAEFKAQIPICCFGKFKGIIGHQLKSILAPKNATNFLKLSTQFTPDAKFLFSIIGDISGD